MRQKLKIGFVGGGLNSAVGRVHEIACRMDHRFVLEAGCFSRHVDVNRKTAEAYDIAPDRDYASIDTLLKNELGKLDVIGILTPPDQHAEQICAALKSGYAVISEKPLAVSSAECDAIRTALNETGGFMAVTYNYLAYPMIRELAAMIRGKKLGDIQQIQVEMPQEGFLRLRTDTNKPFVPQLWRQHDYNVSTVSLDLGAHLHMFIHFLTGEKPLSTVAMGGNHGNFENLTDSAMCLVKYTNDVSAGVWFTKTALGFRNGLRIRIYGSDGSAEWHQMDPENLIMADRYGRRYTLDRAHPDITIANQDRYSRFKAGHPAGFIEAFANCYDDIADAILAHKETSTHNNPYVFGIDAADEGLRLLEAMAASIETGGWANVVQREARSKVKAQTA